MNVVSLTTSLSSEEAQANNNNPTADNRIYFFIYLTEINSTSKINAINGSIGPPGCGCAPYAKSCGMYKRYLDPSFINCNASVQPLITWFTPKVAGVPLSIELSNTFPLISVPW